MKNFNTFSKDLDSINEGLEKLIPRKWIIKLFRNKSWRKILGLEDIKISKRALTQTEKSNLLQSINHLKNIGDESLITDLLDAAFMENDKLVILSRQGNKIDLKFILAILDMHNANKLDKEVFEKFIKILPEKFPDGQLCASRFRLAMGGNKLTRIPNLKVSKGIKFSLKEDSKIIKQVINLEKYWDKSTWTPKEVEQGYKEFTEVMDIALGLETGLKSVKTGKKQWAIDYFTNELKQGSITKQEFETFVKEIEKWKDWELQTQVLPYSLRYAPREISIRIWDKQKFMQKYSGLIDPTGDYKPRANAMNDEIDGKTSVILNWIPENWSSKPTRETLRNIFYHEAGHAKDVSYKLKVPKDYRPQPEFTDEVGKGFYKTFHKGKEKIKEWDFYKNYFIHQVENKVITRAALEDMRSNANKWLKSRHQAYKDVGWDDLNSRKGSTQDTIEWFKSIKDFLRKSEKFMNASGDDWKQLSKEDLISVRNFWDLMSSFDVESFNLVWLKELRNKNPKEFKIYAKKLATQIDEWIEKLKPQAFESTKYKYLIDFNFFN